MIHSIYALPLPFVLFAMAFGVLVWAFLAERISEKLQKPVNAVLAVLAVLAVIYVTLFRRQSGKGEVFLMPFHSFAEARAQKEMYRSMLMNVFLFTPLGVTLPFALPKKIRHPVGLTVFAAALFSVGIEAVQYCEHLGRCETDDVIMNVLGAAIGCLSFILYRKNKKEKN